MKKDLSSGKKVIMASHQTSSQNKALYSGKQIDSQKRSQEITNVIKGRPLNLKIY